MSNASIQLARAVSTARARVRVGGLLSASVALFLFLGLMSTSLALAGSPSHSRTSEFDLLGAAPDPGSTHPAQPFNHACGAAVDSKGDIYVASAGNGAIDVFNPAREYLKTIIDGNEPCGLAVDSKGDLYVSEKAVGKVVKYIPNAFPFSGIPTYGAAIPIDSSGSAKGIAVDPFDDRLYVAEGSHVAVYEANGSFEANIGEAILDEATGVGAYTYAGGQLYVFVADPNGAAGDRVDIFTGGDIGSLAMKGSIDGKAIPDSTACPSCSAGFSFGPAGSPVEADPTSGHFFIYDAAHSALDEFEATGQYVDQVFDPSLADAAPSGIAVAPQRDEVQHVSDIASGGTFTLSYEGDVTAPIPYNAGPDQIQAALEAITAIGAGDVSVGGQFNSAFLAGSYYVAFTEGLSGRDVPQLAIDGSGLTGGSPLAFTGTQTQGSGPGALYVAVGTGAGARLLSFAPLAAPSRAPLFNGPLSHVLASAGAVATDSVGNVYVAAGSTIHVYGPGGAELTKVETTKPPKDVTVDATGKVYALIGPNGGNPAEQIVQYYTPSSYPPTGGTTYGNPVTVATGNSFLSLGGFISSIGINPASGHVFAGAIGGQIIELGSAAEGSPILNPCFACGLESSGLVVDIAAYGSNGDVYVSNSLDKEVEVFNSTGSEVLARIGGAGSPRGPYAGTPGLAAPGSIAVDQSNGHVLVFDRDRTVAEEYDAAGAFIAQFGGFQTTGFSFGIAIDNSGGPSNGKVYIAYDEQAPGTPDLWAFGPLSYGESPAVVTGTATALGAGNATLRGSVNPNGIDLTDCHFEWVPEAAFESTGFSDLSSGGSPPCVPGPAGIGKASAPVAVHADLSGLDPEKRYRFRLLAANKFGESHGGTWLFGPPLLTSKAPLQVLHDEATLRAEIDPSGSATKYRFLYGVDQAYGQSTPTTELAPGDGAVVVQAPLTGLLAGAEYHFRLVVENEAKSIEGPDQTLVTVARRPPETCSNVEFRTGLSANLPDCRAYELVTPAETRGATPQASGPASAGETFNNWLAAPRGPNAGGSLAYFASTLPGFDGTGALDGYRAHRSAGAHPAAGWASELSSPTYAQLGGGSATEQSATTQGVASDQEYWLWRLTASKGVASPLPTGNYLRTPAGFELVGQGTLFPKTDPNAYGDFLSPGGTHVIFSSRAHLEPEAAPAGTAAIYDRAAGAGGASVVSIKPGGGAFAAGENAAYVGTNEGGTAVAFKVGTTLYLHHGSQTDQVVEGADAFAGISDDGRRLFYSKGGALHAFDAEAHSSTEIAAASTFLNVSSDGSRVYFTSEDALTGVEDGVLAEPGEHNLYTWDGATTRFVAILDPQDFASFNGNGFMNLLRWTSGVSVGPTVGRDDSPTRSTPDGSAFVFQSHARLTPYDNGGHSEVYRYEPGAEDGRRLSCVSCDPTDAPASGDAMLQTDNAEGVVQATTLIGNVTDEGGIVFFESPDRLVPEDANDALDVYEWKGQGAAGCVQARGCLALISSGQGEGPSYLYGMSADGHDVFFETQEKLVEADITGSPSIYDARIEGGIPDPLTSEDCQGDACQGQGSPPPVLANPASNANGGGNLAGGRCATGKRQVRHNGKVRCMKRPVKKHRRPKQHRAKSNQGAHR